MAARDIIQAAAGSSTSNYADDVFSAYIYDGNGANRSIANGINLSANGGLVWVKRRSNTATHHVLTDTARGTGQTLYSDTTDFNQNYSANGVSAFNTNGFSLGTFSEWNSAADTYVAWTFRKAQKFFDVVTWTGNGTGSRAISHSLGATPGMIVMKRTDGIGSWYVYHQSLGFSGALQLETTSANLGVGYVSATTASTFTTSVNTNTETYVAYIFAHDTATDGVVQCGSFTTDGSGLATVNLGWEPQFVLCKSSSTATNWFIFDAARNFPVDTASGVSNVLCPNLNAIDSNGALIYPNASGFKATSSAGVTYIYMAIRRPNKPPTTGTQVYNTIARTGTSANANVTGIGFAPDTIFGQIRNSGGSGSPWAIDRLRGLVYSSRVSTTLELAQQADGVLSYEMDGYKVGADSGNGNFNLNVYNYINWFFKRAPGVFDIACTNGGVFAEPHNLGVPPELIITKRRNTTSTWYVCYGPVASSSLMSLETTAAGTAFGDISAQTTSTTFYGAIFGTGFTVVSYLFASKAGISKVGTYTGNGGTAGTNGTSQTINCGFAAGARFVMIKRTDSTGSWYVWDSTRGIVAANDPYLFMGSAADEVTTADVIDPDNTGFIINQLSATNLNVTSATYLYLAFA